MRRGPRNNTSQACTNCQKRKSRCSGASGPDQSCTYCRRTHKTCKFQEPPVRTPLTRGNLDAAERRCVDLERLLETLCPGIDVSKALADAGLSRNISPESQPRQSLENLQVGVGGGDRGWGANGKHSGKGTDIGSSPDAPQPNRPFEWRHTQRGHYPMLEDEHSADQAFEVEGDGMANLYSIDSGYLGSSAGSDLLLEIASLLPDTSTILATTPGVDTSEPSEHFDPPYLYSSAVAVRLIDAYFLFYNSCYPLFHEKTFRSQVSAYWGESRRRTSARDVWPVLYYMVLAMGYWASTPYKPKALSPYFLEARSRLSMSMFETGDIKSLQASLLIGNYLQKCGDRLNAGYIFLGMSIRIALAMGLHREVTYTPNDIISERRRRLFAIVYVFDSGFSITTGRPLTMSLEGFVDCKPLSNIDDKEIECSLDLSRDQVDYPTCSSGIIGHAQLAQLSNEIFTKFLLAHTHRSRIEYQVAELLDSKLHAWFKGLPSYFFSDSVPEWFHAPREIIHWKYHNIRMLLWRGAQAKHPFLSDIKPSAHENCFDIAITSINQISEFCRNAGDCLNMSFNWYATYHLFQATLAMESSYFSARAEAKADASYVRQQQMQERTILWARAIERTKEALRFLAKNNASANRCLEVVDKIHQQFEAQNSRSETTSGQVYTQPEIPNVGMLPTPDGTGAGNMGFDFTGMGNFGIGLDDFQTDQTLRLLVDQMPLGTNMDMSWEALFSSGMNMEMPLQ